MAKVRSRQWRDEHAYSAYPFEDRATLTNDAGDLILSDLLLDAVLHPAGAVGPFYLSQINIENDECTLVIGGSSEDSVCSGTFSLQTPPDVVGLVDSNGRSAGLLVSEPIRWSLLQSWSAGSHVFTEDETPFVAAVQLDVPTVGVTGVLLDSGEILSGDVWLVGGPGIILSLREQNGYPVIRVDAVGEPLFRRENCSPDQFQSQRFLQRIVFQKGGRSHTALPNNWGDIQITVGSQLVDDTVLRITNVERGLLIYAVGERLEGIR